jgi:hypothetical protein
MKSCLVSLPLTIEALVGRIKSILHLKHLDMKYNLLNANGDKEIYVLKSDDDYLYALQSVSGKKDKVLLIQVTELNLKVNFL